MPALDHRIMLTYDAGGTTNEHGEYTPDERTLEVWAELRSIDTVRQIESGGASPGGARVYRVRYDSRILAASEGGRAIGLTDAGFGQGVVALAEPVREGRRRFLDLVAEPRS